MFVRNAKPDDIERIYEIYAAAKAYMRAHGNDVQWVGIDFPNHEKLVKSIENGETFVVADSFACGPCDGAEAAAAARSREDGERLVGVFAFIEGDDPTYHVIENGSWKDDGPYATVHRLGSSGEVKGVGDCVFSWATERCAERGLNLRCDTHELNLTMQNLLKKNGFGYCGIIYEPDNTPRLAFQKTLR